MVRQLPMNVPEITFKEVDGTITKMTNVTVDFNDKDGQIYLISQDRLKPRFVKVVTEGVNVESPNLPDFKDQVATPDGQQTEGTNIEGE